MRGANSFGVKAVSIGRQVSMSTAGDRHFIVGVFETTDFVATIFRQTDNVSVLIPASLEVEVSRLPLRRRRSWKSSCCSWLSNSISKSVKGFLSDERRRIADFLGNVSYSSNYRADDD